MCHCNHSINSGTVYSRGGGLIMEKKHKRKQGLIIFLSCVLFTSSILSCFSATVYALNSNDIRAAYINFAKGKTLSEISGLDALTPEELRLIGVFLSNFYVPFSSTLAESTSDDEVKSDMANALATGANFDKDVAQVLVEYVWSMSLATAKPLYVGVVEEDNIVRRKATSNEDGNTYGSLFRYPMMGTRTIDNFNAEWLPADDTGTLASYFAFMTFFGGGTHKDDDFTKLWKVFEGKKFCLYWTDESDNSNVVFSSSRYASQGSGSSSKMIKEFSASTASYAMINDNLNYSNGYGSSMTSVSSMEEFDALSTEDKETVSIINSQMYVDCFGNILLDTGAQHFIMLPACANPYVWYGTDKGEDSLGSQMNLVNLFALGEAESNQLHRDDSNYYVDFYTGDASLFNLKNWRLYYNNSELKIDAHFLDKEDDKDRKKLARSLKSYLGQSQSSWGDDATVFQNWNNYFGAFDANKTSAVKTKSSYKTGYTASVDNIIDDMIFFDSLNKFQGASTEDSSYSAFKTTDYGIFKKSGTKYVPLVSGLSGITSNISGTKLNKVTTVANAKVYVINVFVSYVFAYYESDGSHVKFAYSAKNIPDVSSVDLSNLSIKIDSNYQVQQLQSMIYYFLHPTEGIKYVVTWFKNKVGGILVGWHEDMVGNTSTGSTTGSTRYVGFSGYVTVPNLNDIEWTDWLLHRYDSLLIYFIFVIMAVMMGYVMLGSISIQKAILSTLLFAICAYFPPIMINFMVNTSNSVCDGIYGDKFTYWALVQHEQYVGSINSAIEDGNASDYLISLFEKNVADSSATSNVVTLKWMSPKKDNYLANIQNELHKTSKSLAISKFLGGIMSEQYGGESYLDKSDSLYLYRSYTDIGSYSSTFYKKMVLGTAQIDNINLSSGKNLNSIFVDYKDISKVSTDFISLSTAINRGFNFDTNSVLGAWAPVSNKRFYPILTSKTVSKAIESGLDGLIIDMDSSSLAGIPRSYFNTTIADFNGGTVDAKKSSIATFGVFTESPFYYFSWNLYDQITSESSMATSVLSGAVNPYLNLFNMVDGGYFYNLTGDEGTAGFGDMRDYMDMRSLFTLVIPYLKSANSVVLDWSNKYGLSTYEDVRLEYNQNNELIIPQEVQDAGKDSELYYKYWHNANVAQLFNMYSPWVGTMYDCDYAKGQYISVLGERFFVKDPLDPSSYYEKDAQGNIIKGRQMIFSESEMLYWGLTKADLTSVEVKILQVQTDSYTDLLQLMDYYTFDSDVINTAAAMIETFNFSKVFSQTSPFGESHIMYPQSYELKNFSYDAYLRLILSGSTGEKLQSSDSTSIYTRVIRNSSITTGLVLLILDMFAVYAIPALKFFFIVAIFFMSILMILSATVKLEINLARVLKESLLEPLIKFLGISIGMAWVVSLFMSNGNTAITKRGGTVISLGDPVMVLLVMIVINAVVLVLYFRTVKKVAKDCVKYAKAVGSSVVGMGGGLLSTLAGGMLAGKIVSGRVDGSGGVVARAAANGVSAFGKAGGALAGGAVAAKNVAHRNLSLDGRSNKYNDRINKGKEKIKNFQESQQDRKDIAETYRQQAQDKSLNSLDRKIAQGKSKIADASVKVHEKGNAMINNNLVARGWESHNRAKQMQYADSSIQGAKRNKAKADIVQRKGKRVGGKKSQ